MVFVIRIVWFSLILLKQISCISLDYLLPYGLSEKDQSLEKDKEDSNSVEAKFSVPFVFYQREFDSVFINENGMVSFLTEVPSFYNVEMPMDYPIIAPYYTDVDIRKRGQIYWRVSKKEQDLSRVNSIINPRFSGLKFSATEVLVVTWDQVGRFDRKQDKLNTFQLVLASDGTTSFTLFLYPTNGIQWHRGSGKNRNSPDARAQAGFMFLLQDGKYHLLPYSGRDQILNIASWSNTDVPGLWVYRVGRIDALDNVQPPSDLVGLSPSAAKDCELGATVCHSEATCSSTEEGFCCACNKGWYGNGENCLEMGQPQRVNGRVNGVINGVTISQQDLHCYVVTTDGRTYTAISRVSPEIGWDLQGLVPLGTVISWLFATPGGEARNGFSLTGGELNYTAEVGYPETGHKATIQINIKGMNVFDYLTADVQISGTVPKIPRKAKVSVEDQTMQFSRIDPGLIKARSEHQYTIEGTSNVVPYTVQQTIRYKECSGSAEAASVTMKLVSERNFIIYDDKEEIVRYAMTSSTSELTGQEDPCAVARCDQNSRCMVTGQSFSCECLAGFGKSSNGGCADVDECMNDETNNCGEHSHCINTQGSYECRCKEGYIGDGINCYKEISCEELSCSPDSECRMNSYNQGECVCRQGYEGDGTTCTLIPSKVLLRGFAEPKTLSLDLSKLESKPLGPAVKHLYELANEGPFDVGHLIINVSWPLQDDNGKWILYLHENPYIEYSHNQRNTRENCEIDPILINHLKLEFNRKRRNAEEYDDAEEDEEDEEDNDDEEINPEELDYAFSDTGLGTVYPMQYEDEVYDYSHLSSLLLNTDSEDYAPQSVSSKSNPKPETIDSEYPVSDRVVQDTSAPTYSGSLFGRINFICKIRLAVNEVAMIHINSHLHTKSVKENFSGVSKFSIQSDVEMIQTEFVKAKENDQVNIVTVVKVNDPIYKQGPGSGMMCGTTECHKYASCNMVLGQESKELCQCPEGFTGDGVTDCQYGEPITDATVSECQEENPYSCGEFSECILEAESSRHRCVCKPGYYGDGRICAIDTSREPVYPEDRKVSNPSALEPECIYGVCTCQDGYTFDGQYCVSDKPATPTVTLETCTSNANCRELEECVYHRLERVYACSCKAGFIKTRDQCISNGEDLCARDNGCRENQVCQFDGRERRRKCACKAGYLLQENECIVNPDAGCDILNNCHQFATCELDRVTRKHQCRCMNGYSGNGTECEKEQVIGCNVLNNCGRFASCQFHAEEKGFRCLCDTARGFEGDGFSCSPVVSCDQNPAVCDPNSDCLNPRDGNHGCRCKHNYFGDGLSCEPVPRYEGNFLVLAQGMALIKVPFSGKGSKPINIKSNQLSSGIDIDCTRGKMFWTDVTNKLIQTSNIDGSNLETFISEDFSFPEGLAVDWVSRNIYVTDPGTDSIHVISIDNKMRFKIIEDSMESPRGIALHPTLGRIYWTDWDRYGPRVEMANMDGTGRQILVDFGIGEPNSIAVDFYNYEVCWTDAGRPEWNVKPKIDCIGANGSGRRTVIELSEGEYPYGIAITENRILWTDWKRKNIHSVDKSSGVRQKPIPYVLAGVSKPYDLVNVPEECPNLTNSCQGQPCGSNRMCLPNGTGGHTCR